MKRPADYPRQVRTLAAEFGFHDPMHAGELAQLFDGAGRRRKYVRRSGLSLDAFAEIVWDRGLTPERLRIDEILELLSQAFDSTTATKRRQTSRGVTFSRKTRPSKRAIADSIDSQAERAKKMRMRKFVCDSCGMILRGAMLTADGREVRPACGHCDGRPLLTRVDPTFAEVMVQTLGLECAS
jgi:hypothetical protein